jgi:methionyl-tRNA synthetase
VTHRAEDGDLVWRAEHLTEDVQNRLAQYQHRLATEEILAVVAEANRYLDAERPWEHLSKGNRLRANAPDPEAVVRRLEVVVRAVSAALVPFTPRVAKRLAEGKVPAFPRIELP